MATALLREHEQQLVGTWVATSSGIVGDEVCKRVDALVRNHLVYIDDSQQYGAWFSLYQGPCDGRFWERYYPQGEMHGGGPAALRCITKSAAKANYEF